MADFTIKQGDLDPAIAATILDADGAVQNLTGATVTFRLATAAIPPVEVFSRDADIDDAALGLVAYTWQAGDTDTVGAYYAEFVINWSVGHTQTIPSQGYYLIAIEPKL
jgi:BppU N-terminal domain